MELPGLTKELYGMTKADAWDKRVCISCKQKATWSSPAGEKEYTISGLCEPCFDRITGDEDLMEITMHKQVGSDVEGVLNNDHAQAAEEFLRQAHFDDKWMVVVADDKVLMLDYDQRVYDVSDDTFPEQFYVTLGVLEQVMGMPVYFAVTPSKGGNTHVTVNLTVPLPIVERIAWQAAFGSDPKREALHLLSVSRGELNPILLFMRKPEPQKLLSE
jgi:hypothetical protein